MDRHDEEIDRVLRMLGTAEAEGGLEARVLARLARPRSAFWQGGQFWWRAGAFGAAAVLGLLVFMPATHVPSRAPAIRAGEIPLRPSSTLEAEALDRLQISPPGIRAPSAGERPAGRRSPIPVQQELAADAAIRHPDRGLADLPSQLAPPAPVTEQERRLLQVAYGPDHPDLGLLNQVERERLEERSAAEFVQFFPPPTPKEIYLATHLAN